MAPRLDYGCFQVFNGKEISGLGSQERLVQDMNLCKVTCDHHGSAMVSPPVPQVVQRELVSPLPVYHLYLA